MNSGQFNTVNDAMSTSINRVIITLKKNFASSPFNSNTRYNSAQNKSNHIIRTKLI